MITVRGIAIYVDELEILQTIKQQVYEQQGREILRKIKKSGNNIQVCCPVHNNGQERKPSCGIVTVDRKGYPAGTFNCFSCGVKGTFDYFVSKCFQKDDVSFGTKWLLDNFVSGDFYARKLPQITLQRPNVLNLVKPKVNYVSEEELATYRYYHPYMWQRKLTPEIVEKYDVGYQKDFVLVTKNDDGTEKTWPPIECLTFPVRDKDGNCLFVSRRAIYDKNFFLPPNLEKPVYGIYELPENCSQVVICESVFNALTCVAYGVPAVALFGTGDDNQYNILNKLPVKHYILGLDPDKAGNKGTWKLKRNLQNKILSKLVIPYGKDINDLSYEEFIRLPQIYI